MRAIPVRSPTNYTPQFRADALNLIVQRDRTFSQLSRDLGVSVWTLKNWWRAEMVRRKKKRGEPSTAVSQPPGESVKEQLARAEQENARLHRKIEQLEMDREILKKAAAFFVKESE